MTYRQTLDYFYQHLPMFHRIGPAAYKADLAKTLAVADMLGNPEKDLKAIHIAGTNGKGSVSHMLASILSEAGYKTGLYTSPHLKDFRERIRINGVMIPKSTVSAFVHKYKKKLDEIEPSFFEMSFGLCMDYFRREYTQIAVMETGMGGRLDSTNILHPELCIITNISLDHTAFLGHDLATIAGEKAGIIKEGVPVIIGETYDETKDVFLRKAMALHSPLSFSEEKYALERCSGSSLTELKIRVNPYPGGESFALTSPLPGNYQLLNIRTVLAATDVLNQLGYPLQHQEVLAGIRKTKENTGLRGRWDLIRKRPRVICDTGHNPAGIREVVEQIKSLSYSGLHIVLGMVDDKDIRGSLSLFPQDATYYFCKADIPRGMDARHLKGISAAYGLHGHEYSSVRDAYQAALASSKSTDLVFVGGSTFVVAEVIS